MQHKSAHHLQCISLAILATMGMTAWAQTTPTERRPGPPAEAFSACKALKASDPCNFSGRRGNVSGSCWAPEGKPLVCRPKDAPTNARSKPASRQQ